MATHQPPQQQGGGAQGATMEKLVAKEREVAAKLQNLKDRQQKALQLLDQIQPNWPGHFLCISPVVFHKIDKAVPPDRIGYAKSSYTNYFITIFLICFNIICAIAAFASETKESREDKVEYGKQLGTSFVHILGIPGAFVVWHYQVYLAVQPRGPLTRYGVAYLGLFIALLYNIFMAVGYSGYGACGLLFAFHLKDYKKSQVPFYLALVCGLLFAFQFIYFVFSIFRLRKYHRQDKAQLLSNVAGVVLP